VKVALVEDEVPYWAVQVAWVERVACQVVVGLNHHTLMTVLEEGLA